MRIPEFVGPAEFARSLEYNRKMIDDVISKFDSGCFSVKELDNLIMAARRTAYVCQQLMEWRNVKILVAAAAEKDGLDEFYWE
jgi:hypothetical protein